MMACPALRDLWAPLGNRVPKGNVAPPGNVDPRESPVLPGNVAPRGSLAPPGNEVLKGSPAPPGSVAPRESPAPWALPDRGVAGQGCRSLPCCTRMTCSQSPLGAAQCP